MLVERGKDGWVINEDEYYRPVENGEAMLLDRWMGVLLYTEFFKGVAL